MAILAVLSVAAAFPQHLFTQDEAGQFAFNYASDAGHSLTQRGYLKAIQSDQGMVNIPVQEGKYQYYAPDGVLYKISFTADERGFNPIIEKIPAA